MGPGPRPARISLQASRNSARNPLESVGQQPIASCRSRRVEAGKRTMVTGGPSSKASSPPREPTRHPAASEKPTDEPPNDAHPQTPDPLLTQLPHRPPHQPCQHLPHPLATQHSPCLPDLHSPPPTCRRPAPPHTPPRLGTHHPRSTWRVEEGGPQRSGGPPSSRQPSRGANTTPCGGAAACSAQEETPERNSPTKHPQSPLA